MGIPSSPGGPGRRTDGEAPGPDLAPLGTARFVPPDSPRRGAAAGRDAPPARPAPTRRQLRPWPSATGRSSGLLPLGELLGGQTVVWAVVVQRDDGQPAEAVVAFGSQDDAGKWAANSPDVGSHTVVPMRFASGQQTRPAS